MPLITIASVTIPNWQGSASGVSLRIYANESFTAQSGSIVPKSAMNNPPSLGTFFDSTACTVSAGSLEIPAITLESTVDSPDNPDATYSAVLWDGTSGQLIQNFGTTGKFAVPADEINTTWADIFAAGAAK